MDTANNPTLGDRAVGLGDLKLMSQIILEFCVSEPFEKTSPMVTVNTRSE